MIFRAIGEQFARIQEKGIDILARRVYVHSVPEADGSNPESGRSAERRRVWGQTWSCRRSALSRSSRAGASAPPWLESDGLPAPGYWLSPATRDVTPARAASPHEPIILVRLESS